jgi:hypothetical protein
MQLESKDLLCNDEFTYLVFLNGKRLVSFLAANEEEGWVDIPDIATMAPINKNAHIDFESETNWYVSPWEIVPTKRLQGQVVIKKIYKSK